MCGYGSDLENRVENRKAEFFKDRDGNEEGGKKTEKERSEP